MVCGALGAPQNPSKEPVRAAQFSRPGVRRHLPFSPCWRLQRSCRIELLAARCVSTVCTCSLKKASFAWECPCKNDATWGSIFVKSVWRGRKCVLSAPAARWSSGHPRTGSRAPARGLSWTRCCRFGSRVYSNEWQRSCDKSDFRIGKMFSQKTSKVSLLFRGKRTVFVVINFQMKSEFWETWIHHCHELGSFLILKRILMRSCWYWVCCFW